MFSIVVSRLSGARRALLSGFGRLFGITDTTLTIHGKDPTGRDFPPATVRVEPGMATIVNLNLQAQWV